MECPSCHRQVPDSARFCPFCSAELSAQSEPTARLTPVQQTVPVPPPAAPPQPAPTPAAAAPAPVAVEPEPQTKSTAPWMLACGISCAAVLLLAVIGVGIYFGLPALRNSGATTTSGQAQPGTTGGATQATTPVTEPPAAPPVPAGLAGEWNIVYWGGEGDWPTAVSLREEGSSVVGELVGRYETHIELEPAGSVRWTGTYKDANMPDGVPAIATLPGADRIRLVDDNIPGLDNVILIADRPGGSDFGPHPRAETDDQAIEAVSAEPKVAAWLQEIEQAKAQGRKTSARFEIEENFDDYCIVHVFEMVEDDGGGGHTATFGRYFVWKASGLVVFLP